MSGQEKRWRRQIKGQIKGDAAHCSPFELRPLSLVLVSGLPDSLDITSAYIDGNGGTLALAYLPDDVYQQAIAGDVVFDINESWEVEQIKGGK